MKNLRKIIALFAFIFLAGILITVITINTSLNKSELQNNPTVKVQKDTLYLLKAEKKTV
jgi:preprotein translocase subunit SecG